MHGELFHVTDIRDPIDGWAPQAEDEQPPSEAVFEARRRRPLAMLDYVQCHSGHHRIVGLKVFRDHLRPHNWPVLTRWCDVCLVLRRRDTRAVAARGSIWQGEAFLLEASCFCL